MGVAMSENTSSNTTNGSESMSHAPSTTFIELHGGAQVPSNFRTPGSFTIVRLQSSAGLVDRITKTSPVPALLLSVSLKSLPRASYQLWSADKLLPTSDVLAFQSNVIDFESVPRCWAGSAFEYVHYSVPRKGLDDIAEDLGLGRVCDYRLAVLENDLVVAQITRSILPFLGRNDSASVLALDQLSLVLGAHLLERYGIIQRAGTVAKGGLAPWQKRRACEILDENLNGRILLSQIAAECGLSVSHFARSFKVSFGVSAHQWLIRHRLERAKKLMIGTSMTLSEIAAGSGFHDHAAFTRAFQQFVGANPGKWRQQNGIKRFEA